jgi:glycosyltransferase involved in cell wall biosynthesis
LLINDHNIYYKDFFKQLVDDSNIEFYGSVPQKILFEHLKTAMIMFYPNTYPETCCTSILECMAHKCNVITSDLGALAETSNGFANIFNPLIDNVLTSRRAI